MSTIKFTTQVKNREIEIPQEYLNTIKNAEIAGIIITSQSSNKVKGIIAKLMENPLEIEDKTFLTRKIYER